MKGVYTSSLLISGLNSARTLLYITAPAAKAVKVRKSKITNATNETNEQCRAAWRKVSSLGTPTATTITPAKHEDGDQAASATVKGNVTASEPTYAADSELAHGGFPSLTGHTYPEVDAEAEELIIPPGATYGLYLYNTPTSFDAVVSATHQEIG